VFASSTPGRKPGVLCQGTTSQAAAKLAQEGF
jgi:hypothetical protein